MNILQLFQIIIVIKLNLEVDLVKGPSLGSHELTQVY